MRASTNIKRSSIEKALGRLYQKSPNEGDKTPIVQGIMPVGHAMVP
jgi:hypothetical protein